MKYLKYILFNNICICRSLSLHLNMETIKNNIMKLNQSVLALLFIGIVAVTVLSIHFLI